ncbi:MAG: hypothetical protein M1381_05260 [Deltaproteobacteria bacterium]|nr:hypothetical protein [Deltaproteobacteria bacterium]MCL5792260.1 hypothetical protein [Deltaproteobacteria bacterium]
MRQLTISGIPNQIENIINREVKRNGVSLNKAFISLLERVTGITTEKKKSKTLYHDLDHLSGVWAKEEASHFKKNLDAQRKIDDGLWKKTE